MSVPKSPKPVNMLICMAKWTLLIKSSSWTLKQGIYFYLSCRPRWPLKKELFSGWEWKTDEAEGKSEIFHALEVFDKKLLAPRCRGQHVRAGERILGAKGGPKLAASKVNEISVPLNTWYLILPRPKLGSLFCPEPSEKSSGDEQFDFSLMKSRAQKPACQSGPLTYKMAR